MTPINASIPSTKLTSNTETDRLRFAMNAAGIGVWEVDLVTNSVIWDDRCRELFGLYRDNPLPYEEAIEYIHPDDAMGVNEQVQAALRGENNGSYNATYRTLGADDGKLRWVNFTGTAYFDTDRQLTRFGGVALEVTESYASQQRMLAFQQKIITLLENSWVAIAINARDGLTFTAANAFYGELVGRRPGDIIGKPLLIALPELAGKGFDEMLNGVLNTGIPYYAEEKAVELIRHGKQETVYVNFAYQPLPDENDNISSILTIVTDVTQQVTARHKTEEQVVQRTLELEIANESLRAINKELARSNHHLEEFAHAASHDLKEPIRKVRLFTSLLKDQLSQHLKDSAMQYFNRIETATERMGSLVDDLLLYSHVSQQPHEKVPVDLNDKLLRVQEDLDLDIQEKGAVMRIDNLPVVNGYPRQLQQLFQNLLSNAIKYSRADAPPVITIKHRQVEEGGQQYCLFEITDNGIGFEQEYADKIFQMFTRLHGRNEYSGTGVGLSIVKKIVENHSGMIRVESQNGIGSTFNVYLPCE